MLIVFDTKFNLYEKDSDEIFQQGAATFNQLPGGNFIDPEQLQTMRVPISKLQITLEDSVMPRTVPIFESTNQTTTYFYPHELARMDPTYNMLYPAYFEFYLYRSGFTETYRRYYPRIDSMLG